jgi:hypothetical protein
MIIDLTPSPTVTILGTLFILALGAILIMCIIDWLFRKLDKGK